MQAADENHLLFPQNHAHAVFTNTNPVTIFCSPEFFHIGQFQKPFCRFHLR